MAPLPVAFDRTQRRRGVRRGLGLAELLIAGSVAATLLLAVGAAVSASFQSYAINHVRADTTQRARIALDRLLATVRVTEDHAPADVDRRADFASGLVVEDTGILMFNDSGEQIGWVHDAASKELRFTSPSGSYVMLRQVQAFRVTFEPMRSLTSVRTGGAHDRLRRASVLLTVGVPLEDTHNAKAAGETFTLSSSVIPRRNIGL